MRRRSSSTSLFVLLLSLIPSTAHATETVTGNLRQAEDPPRLEVPLSLDFSAPRYRVDPSNSILSSVTMRRLPPGSLLTTFDGLHAFALRHVRSQYRRFTRRALRSGWYVLPDDTDPSQDYRQIDVDVGAPSSNGAWWTRSWMDSMLPEEGGAPAQPYNHIIGKETSWKFGPFTLTNTFKLRFDYVGFFELNPDPVSPEHAKRSTTLALDVRALSDTTVGTDIRFHLRPHFRVGLPTGGDWMSVLRGVSLRGYVEISHRRQEIVKGEVEIKWDPDDGMSVTAEFELVRW